MKYNIQRPSESLNNLTPQEYRLMAKNRSPKKCVELKQVCLQMEFTQNKALEASSMTFPLPI